MIKLENTKVDQVFLFTRSPSQKFLNWGHCCTRTLLSTLDQQHSTLDLANEKPLTFISRKYLLECITMTSFYYFIFRLNDSNEISPWPGSWSFSGNQKKNHLNFYVESSHFEYVEIIVGKFTKTSRFCDEFPQTHEYQTSHGMFYGPDYYFFLGSFSLSDHIIFRCFLGNW